MICFVMVIAIDGRSPLDGRFRSHRVMFGSGSLYPQKRKSHVANVASAKGQKQKALLSSLSTKFSSISSHLGG